jgi:Methylamine utilisation protein MauE
VNGASLALAARVVLAVVLVVSAIAKMRAHADLTTRLARLQMGRLVGQAFAPVIEPVLPVAEIGVAVALVAWWSPVPGVVALLLLATFTVVLVRAQVHHVPCLCFGTASLEAPVGPWAIVRNGFLAGLAVIAIGNPTGAKVGATVVLCLGLGAVAAAVIRVAR